MHRAIRGLGEDTNIVILPVDKGNAMVVMDRTEYTTKIVYGRARGWVARSLSAMAMNVCSACGSEHAYIATKWCSVMNLATKFAENDSLR